MSTDSKINHQWDYKNLPSTSIHSIFEFHAKKNPLGIALVCKEECLTYEDLNNKSNQIASYLIEKKIQPEELIGIFCTRSFEMIIGLLGILKAGGAYVPLDPEYPQDRLSHMIGETNLSLILTNTEKSEKLPVTSEVIDINSILKKSNSDIYNKFIKDNHLAYVIFTSGSSGKPKASLLEHKGLVNIAYEQIKVLEVNKNSRILQFASLSFDAATWEWIMALCSGASLYLLSYDEVHSPEKLNNYVVKNQISHATIPPALLPLLQRDSWASVSHLIVAGESCNLSIANLWAKNRNFYNAYGPSEATICTTIAKFNDSVENLHLGKPIANTCVYIMDENLNQVDQGELYIGGVGLSRGYLNQEELNFQKFIKNPDESSPHNTLYRSGDLVRIDSCGNILFLGRADNQVKIRGNRIELEEIESVLLSHPYVIQATLAAINEGENNKVLLAWVVPDKQKFAIDEFFLEMELRKYLTKKLPDFMQAARIIILDEMPLTLNNKIDKSALPIPDLTRHSAPYVEPENEIERKLCTIWQDILEISKIGIADNFYWLGGNSLSATQIISRIRKEFDGLDLPFSLFIKSGNIKNLAIVLNDNNNKYHVLPDIEVSSGNSRSSKISSIQRSTLFMQSMDKSIPYCNTPIVFTIEGCPDFNNLKQAIQLEIETHEILRSFYIYEKEKWIKTTKEEISFDYEFFDISDVNEKENSLKNIIDSKQKKNFDLTTEIPLKLFIIKIEKDRYILGFIFHQIAFDGQSSAIFMRKISDNYNKIGNNSIVNIGNKKTTQYIDYTHWRDQLKIDHEHPKSMQWWKKYLEGAPEVHSIPLDFPRPIQQSYAGKTIEFTIENPQFKKINQFACDHHLSLFMLLQAAFWTLIAHYSNKTDIVTGTVSAGRLKGDFQDCIGNFSNILVLRGNIADNPTFQDFVQRVKANIEKAFTQQWIFFDEIVDNLKPKRSLSHNPLVQTMLVIQDERQHLLDLDGLNIKNVFQCPGVAKFDLTLHVYPEKGKMHFRWEYNTNLFKESTISRLNDYLLNVLMRGIDEPHLPLSELDLLSDGRSNPIVENSSNYNIPEPKNVYEIFLENVERNPNKAAIYEGDNVTSYQDLYHRVNYLSQQLLIHGVCSDKQELIAVCMNKNSDLLASMLAIFKLGQIYLPIDPTYPHERISYMVNDANASVIITDDQYEEKFQAYTSRKSRVLNIDKPLAAGSYIIQTENQRDITKVAYVIYTSGSSGKPKGVLISHRNLFYSLLANCQLVGLTENDVIPAIGSQAFGISILEFLMPISCGGSVRIIAPETVKDLDRLIAETQDVTILHAVPSLMRNWLQAVMQRQNIYPHLRVLLTGGEAVPLELLHALKNWNGQLRVLATYGMTEATVICAAYETSPKHTGAYYLGKVHPGSYFRVLNQHNKQQPPGVPGELYIGGPCIAEGYLHKPELTQLKFISDPYDEHRILYQTGDSVRIAEDGNLEFLGRVDNQINLRGIRIEYSEIESLLQDIKEIHQAVVSVKTLSSGEDTLVAYISFKRNMEKPVSEISDYLHKFLPDYMCPNQLVILEYMPLNPNGKIDRQALPIPAIDTYGNAPTTETEKMITLIWQDLLALPEIPVDKSFFELGGNSLLMTKVINRIHAQEGVQLSFSSLFSAPTIRDLSVEVDKIKCKQLVENLTKIIEKNLDVSKEMII